MSIERARIFYVEDNENLRGLVKLVLEDDGHEIVLEAGGLMEALDKAKEAEKKGIDVAIIDNSLGNLGDGALVAKALREASPNTAIIGYSAEEVKFGDRNVLKIPGRLEDLRKAIRELLISRF